MESSERRFLHRVSSYIAQARQYERDDVRAAALRLMPLDALRRRAGVAAQSAGGGDGAASQLDADVEVALLRQLLVWFRKEFFRWVDKPDCDTCSAGSSAMRLIDGGASPTPVESSLGAGRVELYECTACGYGTGRFARYNDAGALLETRAGRCGEWANCFTLCAVAAGFDARLVYDWTDHVWTEVWWPAGRRWLHCDACETALDTPMLYESGWGKRLSYVVAVGKLNVADVTWRYSLDPMPRRSEIGERKLADYLIRTNSAMWRPLSDDRKSMLQRRYLCEVIELIRVPGASRSNEAAADLPGRQSGSLQWRTQRGELGRAAATVSNSVIRPSAGELWSKECVLRYSAVTNCYERPNESGGRCGAKGWQALVFHTENIARKVEHDWDTVYLARQENSPASLEGKLSWRFDLSAGKVDAIEITIAMSTFESGKVRATLCIDEDTCFLIGKDGRLALSAGDVPANGASVLTLEVTLHGGSGDCGWQHAQLFRTSLAADADSDESHGLTVRIKFM